MNLPQISLEEKNEKTNTTYAIDAQFIDYHAHRYFTVGHIQGAIQIQRFKDLADNFANPLIAIQD